VEKGSGYARLLFNYVPRLFELPTALLEYINLLQGDCPPPPPFGLLHLHNYVIKMIEIYTAAQPYYSWWTHAYSTSKQSHRAPLLRIYRLKEDASLPAMFNLLFSFKKNFCNQRSHYGRFPYQMEAITCNRHFFWWTKMNGTQRRAMIVHEECIACTAVWQKAPLGLKRCWIAKKSSP